MREILNERGNMDPFIRMREFLFKSPAVFVWYNKAVTSILQFSHCSGMSDVKIPLNSNWSTFDPLSRSYPYSLIWQGSMAHNFFLRSGVSHEDFSYPHLCIMYIRKENVKQEEIAANSNADRPRWDVAFHKTSTVFNLNHKIVNCRFLKAKFVTT